MRDLTPAQFVDWSYALQRSDERAYAELYDKTYHALYRFVWTITRSGPATDDVLQETYVKLWQIRERADPERSLKALLYQMARNFALNHQRSRRRHTHDSIDDDESLYEPSIPSTTLADLAADDLESRLHLWIDELAPRRREAFCLSRFENMSHEEIADAMGLTPKTVNNHIVLALQQLRGKLNAFDSDAFSYV
jgi:RNA polymerase sigma-70 factor (ECF subfamily)